MRRLASLFVLIATPGIAGAHETVGDAGILDRIGHVLFGLHHLPGTVVLIVLCVLFYRLLIGKASRTR